MDTTASQVPEVDRTQIDSFALLVLCVLMLIMVGIAYALERYNFHLVHETSVSLLLGGAVGLVIKFSNAELGHLVSFDTEFFFFLLLPPIVFFAGYDLHKANFFRHFGSILLYAFVGTTVSTFAIGLMLYGFMQADLLEVSYSMVECFIFGSLISATDPVTVLAIFKSLKVDPRLDSLIFGEAILNDAVAIVLFETMIIFRDHAVSAKTVFAGLGSFIGIFFGSFASGVGIALFGCLLFKHTNLRQYPVFESAIFFVLSYLSYFFAQAVRASGIVSMLFCGIAFSHYNEINLSERSQMTVRYCFGLLSYMAENFIFVYLGLTVFLRTDYVYYPKLILVSFFCMLVARLLNVLPLSFLLNSFSRTTQGKFRWNDMLMMWWAGLRGAIAFALAASISWETGPVWLTTTLVLCLITVFVFGGTVVPMLKLLKIPIGVDPDNETLYGTTRADRQHWFVSVDRKYFQPFFSALPSGVTNHPNQHLMPDDEGLDATEQMELDEVNTGPSTPREQTA